MQINIRATYPREWADIGNFPTPHTPPPNLDLDHLKLLNLLRTSNTETRTHADNDSNGINQSPVFDKRLKDMVEKVESLPLSKDIKRDALDTILDLIRDIDKKGLVWHKPFIEYDDSEYISMEWDKESRSLYLNIDNDEQWWSKVWKEGNKTKTDIFDLDYNNLSIHWKWVFNGKKQFN